MSIQFKLESDVPQKIRDLGGAQLTSARSGLVKDAMIRLLQETVQRNPVDTGRSRAAWVRSLEELGGSPPPGWEGPHPSAVDSGRQLGAMSIDEVEEFSSITATNGVNYISALEYGTSKMPPHAMIRGAMQLVAGRLAEWFRW